MSGLTPVFLRLEDEHGGRHVIELVRYGEGSTFYLPDKVKDKLDVQRSRDASHSIARLDLLEAYAGISIDTDSGAASVLMSGNRAIKIPLSTAKLRLTFVLRDDDHFITTAGIWSLEWDTTGTISASMLASTPAVVEPHDLISNSASSGPSRNGNRLRSATEAWERWNMQYQDRQGVEVEESLPVLPVQDLPTDRSSPVSEVLPIHRINLSSSNSKAEQDSEDFGKSPSRSMLESDRHCDQGKEQTHSRKRRMCEIEQGHDPNKRTKKDREKGIACAEEMRASKTNESDKEEAPVTIAGVHMSVSASNSTTYLSKTAGQSISNPETIETLVHTGQCDQQSPETVETVPEAHPQRSSRVRWSKPVCPKHRTSNRQLQPVVVFSITASKVQNDVEVMASYKKLGGHVTNNLQKANIFCVGSNSLKKTAKFILAIASGKDIVTDQWLEDVHTTHCFPDPQSYLPCDDEKEREWRFTLSDAIARGKNGLTLLNGIDVVLTSQLQVELDDLKAEVKKIALTLGANRVGMKLPKQTSDVKNLQLRMYSKDLLSMAALRGVLELESDEFIIG